MKTFKKKINGTNKLSNVIACFALVFTTFAMESFCFFIFHQPKMPDELIELKDYE